jgi:hypothetical protein
VFTNGSNNKSSSNGKRTDAEVLAESADFYSKFGIPREQHQGLFVLINKARMLNGWTTKTAAELDATIQTWGEAFSFYSIPVDAYPELYRRACDTRQKKMQMGVEVPMMDATLLISHWTGENGLMKERRSTPKVGADHRLNEPRIKVCPRCYDTGRVILGEDRGGACLHIMEDKNA